jgi:hypothetical protein
MAAGLRKAERVSILLMLNFRFGGEHRDTVDIARITTLECVASWGRAAHRRFVGPLLADSAPSVRGLRGMGFG